MKEKLVNLKNKISSFIKKYKKPTIIIVAIAIILILIGIIVLQLTKTKRGNSSGNLNNSGFSVQKGNWIYYLGFNAGKADGIYKIKTDGKGKQKISDDYGMYLNQAGNYLYYLEASMKEEGTFNIVKVKTNGENKEIMVEDVDTSKVTLVDNWIYYFKNYQLYRIKIDGKSKEKLLDKSIMSYEIIGDFIYYSYISDNKYVIAKTKINTDEITKIEMDAGRVFFIDKDIIYYIYENQKEEGIVYELYKMKTTGKDKEKILEINGNLLLDGINFEKNNLYYTKIDENGNSAIYSINTKKKEEIKIIDINSYSSMININNKNIYYTDINENGDSNIFKIKANGTNKNEL